MFKFIFRDNKCDHYWNKNLCFSAFLGGVVKLLFKGIAIKAFYILLAALPLEVSRGT